MRTFLDMNKRVGIEHRLSDYRQVIVPLIMLHKINAIIYVITLLISYSYVCYKEI